MNLSDYFAWAGARAIDSAGTSTLDFKTKGHPEMVFEAVTATDLELKVSWIGGGGSVSANTRCIVKRSTGTEEILDPNTACTALVAGDRLIVPNEGAKSIRLTATAGSGTIASLANPSTFATIVYALLKLIDNGITAVVTGVSTEAKQDTQITSLQLIDDIVSTDSARVLRKLRVVTVDLSITADAAYIANDLITDSTIAAAVVRANDAKGLLVSVLINDENLESGATGADVDLIFVAGNHDWGTPGSEANVSPTNARNVIGWVQVASADWRTMDPTADAGVRIVQKVAGDIGMPMPIRTVSGTDDIYLVLVARGNIAMGAGFWRVTLTLEDFV